MKANIIGNVTPIVEMQLDPGDIIVGESGEVSWLSESIQLHDTPTTVGKGSGWMLWARMRNFFMTEYTAIDKPGMVAFASRAPGQIVEVDVFPNRAYLGHRHSLLCGTEEVSVSLDLKRKVGVQRLAREALGWQRVSGYGTAWFSLFGEVASYTLKPGEVVRVHPGHVGLIEESVSITATRVKGIRNGFFLRNGLQLTQLTGPGRIWLQSQPFARLAHQVFDYVDTQAVLTGKRTADGITSHPFVRGLMGRP